MAYFRVDITETAVQEEGEGAPVAFNSEPYLFKTLQEATEYIAKRYAGVPPDPNGDEEARYIYRDTTKNGPERVGLLFRFKNSDISHASESWDQEDWVSVVRVEEEPVAFWEVPEDEVASWPDEFVPFAKRTMIADRAEVRK